MKIRTLAAFAFLSFTQLGSEAFADPQLPIKIGMPVCLTGACAHSGNNAVHGAELAVADLNKIGGVLGRKFELKVEDSQDALSGSRAVTAYRALRLDPTIHLFIGPSWTPGLLALAPIVSRERDAVMISYDGGVKEFHEGGPNLFNIRGVDEATSRELAAYAFQSGSRSIAIFGGQQAWELEQARFFEDELKHLGIHPGIKIEPPSSSTNLRDEAAKVLATKPDTILFSAYLQLDLALKALHGLGYKGKQFIAFIDDSRIALSGDAIEGAITLNSLKPKPVFRDRVTSSYPKSEATWHAHTAYDAVMVYAEAINQTKSVDAETIAQKIPDIALPGGVSGPFTFGGGRLAVRRGDNLKIVKAGKLEPYSFKKLEY